MSLAQRLCCPQLRELTPYASARRSASGGNVWLNANESPWRNANVAGINRYPDCQPPQLRQAYADYAAIAPSQVLISRGADEGIELLIRAFCVPGQDRVVSLTPSYGMYRISAETCGVDYQAIPWQQGYTLPQALVDAGRDAKLLFVCNPNNPTGTLVPTAELLQLAQALPDTLVVIDEAYIEFCPQQSLAKSIATTPNLVILRTLSKAFALAGARCGFVLANDDIIAMLEKVIAPYPVPVPVSDLALETLSNFGIRRMQSQVSQLNARRQALITALDALPGVGTILDSASNFVLFEAENADALLTELAGKGILIRAYSALPGWLRVSIGSESEMATLMAALEPALQQPRQDA
ncbi:histidinol-phosphate transaminase [Ferrimonas kyonanensis]|uniref:histidinol-phosphate transaminase n=1 Tax=Ferrimonas kyonanensis TaxID=364763 RepID=UPI000406E3D6|nr:histidinol-phosphate transaminase [Ferrimonas kyonanensis]